MVLPVIFQYCRAIWWEAALHDANITCVHLSGSLNTVEYALSHVHMSEQSKDCIKRQILNDYTKKE